MEPRTDLVAPAMAVMSMMPETMITLAVRGSKPPSITFPSAHSTVRTGGLVVPPLKKLPKRDGPSARDRRPCADL